MDAPSTFDTMGMFKMEMNVNVLKWEMKKEKKSQKVHSVDSPFKPYIHGRGNVESETMFHTDARDRAADTNGTELWQTLLGREMRVWSSHFSVLSGPTKFWATPSQRGDVHPCVEGITKSSVEVLLSVADCDLDEEGFLHGIHVLAAAKTLTPLQVAVTRVRVDPEKGESTMGRE